MVTNSHGFPGYTILKSHGIISIRVRCVSETFEGAAKDYTWEAEFANAIKKLEREAARRGANAVICVREEIYKFSSGMFGDVVLILTGTAVTVAEDNTVQIVDVPRTESEAVSKETVRPEKDSTNESFIICPKCGARQRSNRGICFDCGVVFKRHE